MFVYSIQSRSTLEALTMQRGRPAWWWEAGKGVSRPFPGGGGGRGNVLYGSRGDGEGAKDS